MTITIVKGDLWMEHADLLVCAIFEGELVTPDMQFLEAETHGRIQKILKAKKFTGALNQSVVIRAPEQIPADAILVVGLGKRKQFSSETAREVAGFAILQAEELGLRSVAIRLLESPDDSIDVKEIAQGMIEASLLAEYDFSIYKDEKKKKTPIDRLSLIVSDGRVARKIRLCEARARLFVEGTIVARDLVNTPAKDMTPIRLAEVARQIAKMAGANVHVRVLNQEQCEKKGMQAYLAVAKGSPEPPQFIHLTYLPKKPTKKRLVIVGKGVTFDAGGLSLKPSEAMETMKCDMAGAAAVLGLFAMLGKWKPAIEVHGVIAATENMPSGHAIHPGDIVRASNKKTIEILNTDAEGRLTLADALVYAEKLEPTYLIDLATLTGAVVVALGEEIAGLMGNEKIFSQKVLIASNRAGEKVWELPLEPRYAQLLESPVADLRNITKSRYGGSLTAGIFLQQFVNPETPWAHLDIAGPAYAERPLASWMQPGATGFGVRTLAELISML
ncbi:MAG: leucyl aminopeptidase [Patescibacteria group bacterium]|jgi:leucyl aminopeptidase